MAELIVPEIGDAKDQHIRSLESALCLLIKRAEPFTGADIVDETCGTIPLMIKLEHALKLAREALKES